MFGFSQNKKVSGTLFSFFKRKKGGFLLPIIGIIVITNGVSGQCVIKIEPGITENIIITNYDNRPSLHYQLRTGMVLGFSVEYQLFKKFTVEISQALVQKNTRLHNGSSDGFNQNSRNAYLQWPLSFSYAFRHKKLNVLFELGGYEAYWLAAHVSGKMPDILNENTYKYRGKYLFNNQTDKRWESGWLIGCKVLPYLNKKQMFSVRYRFCQSMTGQQKKYMLGQVSRYNQTHSLTIGMMLNKHS